MTQGFGTREHGAGHCESRFGTRHGMLVWSGRSYGIRLEEPPPMSWPRRCVLVLAALLAVSLWGWAGFAAGRALRWW